MTAPVSPPTRHHEWDDPTPPARRPHPPATVPEAGQTTPLPQIDLDADIPDEEVNRWLQPMPDEDEFDRVCGASTVLLPDIRLDTIINFRPHFLGDAKGEPFTIRLTDGLSRMIDILLHSRGTPYRTKSEFFRDAAFLLAKELARLNNLQDPRMRSLRIAAELSAQMDFAARMREQIHQAEHNLTDYLLTVVERGSLSEALRIIKRYEDDARAIPVDWWRDQWLAVLTRNPLVAQVRAAAAARTAPAQTPAV